jgi:hypothetical protein
MGPLLIHLSGFAPTVWRRETPNVSENPFPRGRPWNKSKRIGQKPPLELRDIWAHRTRLEMSKYSRDLVPFNLAIDSKLRGCDLASLWVSDV